MAAHAMAIVSVVIPTLNRAGKVARAISSVLYQTFTDHEIIVVDDGSRDGTREKMSQFGGAITYVAHSSSQGVSAARNTGIKRSSAPFLAFLDSDDYWLPEKLRAQTGFFKNTPEAVVCQTEEVWIRKGRRVNPRNRHQKPSGHIFEASLRLCLVSPSAVMIKRSLLEDVGIFDETLPACEDYDLWLRIACRYPIHLIRQEFVVREGGHPDQLSALHKGMDRFRIKSLVKLIKSGTLNKRQHKAALEELSFKCNIYGNGCLKRGRPEEGQRYLELTRRLGKDFGNNNI